MAGAIGFVRRATRTGCRHDRGMRTPGRRPQSCRRRSAAWITGGGAESDPEDGQERAGRRVRRRAPVRRHGRQGVRSPMVPRRRGRHGHGGVRGGNPDPFRGAARRDDPGVIAAVRRHRGDAGRCRPCDVGHRRRRLRRLVTRRGAVLGGDAVGNPNAGTRPCPARLRTGEIAEHGRHGQSEHRQQHGQPRHDATPAGHRFSIPGARPPRRHRAPGAAGLGGGTFTGW